MTKRFHLSVVAPSPELVGFDATPQVLRYLPRRALRRPRHSRSVWRYQISRIGCPVNLTAVIPELCN